MIIYKITNKVNNKVYIGLTTRTVNERFEEHIERAKNSKHKYYIHNAMNKYGINNFSIEEIDSCDDINELKKKEQYWIEFYKSFDGRFGYNLTKGGDGVNGYRLSDEAKEKLRMSMRGRHHTEETRKVLSEKHKGKCNVKGRVHINKNGATKMVKQEELSQFLSDGWHLGRICKTGQKNKDKIFIHRNNEIKFVKKSEIDEFLKEGWKKGNPELTLRNKARACATKGKLRVFKNKKIKYIDFNQFEEYMNNGWQCSEKTKSKYDEEIRISMGVASQ